MNPLPECLTKGWLPGRLNLGPLLLRKTLVFTLDVLFFQMSPRCANLALKHYLLKPVQRIPQYRLLLTGGLPWQFTNQPTHVAIMTLCLS